MIKSEVIHFQTDIKNGMTLQEALNKHGLTFQEVWKEIHGDRRGRPIKKQQKRKGTGERYIRYTDGKYSIIKKLKSGYVYFGRYDSLEDAVLVRDWMMEHYWDKSRLNALRRRLGV